MLFLFIELQDKYVLCHINKIIKKRRATKDNSHQNIQVGGAQPLDEDMLMGSAFGNSDKIDSFYGK